MMQVTEENIVWAMDKLAVFASLPGFPADERLLRYHAIAFLHVISNRPIREIADERNKLLNDETWKEWKGKTGISPQENDVDWLMTTLSESADQYPFPKVIRATYNLILTPADGRDRILIPE